MIILRIRLFPALLLVALAAACSSTNDSTNAGGTAGSPSVGGAAGAPAGGNNGGSEQGGAAGSSTGGASLAGQDGASAQGGTGPDTVLCAQACDRVKNCGQVDVAACEAQCGKELVGQGYLNPEIALDYFITLRDFKEEVCAYKQGVYWNKWGPLGLPANKFDVLKDQEGFKACLANEAKCNGETSLPKRQSNCMGKFYRWTQDRRDTLKTCYTQKCIEQLQCIYGAQPYLPEPEPWLAGVPDPLAQ